MISNSYSRPVDDMDSLVFLIVRFALLAAIIVVAGSFLAKYADRLGVLTGMGRSMAGLFLLATATSLPELAVGCHAALIPAPDLALGDLLGSSLFNLLILAVLDLSYRTGGRVLSRTVAGHALSAIGSILLTAIVLLFVLVDLPFSFGRIGPGSLAVAVAYLLSLRLIFFDQQICTPALSEEIALESGPQSLRRALAGFVVSTFVILLTAPQLASTADTLAVQTGLGGTFVGTVFVALATSLPEVSTTRAAVRMGAYDLAVGNILGSNTFNMVALVGIDLFYPGSLLASVSNTHAITAAAVVIVTAVVTMGMLYRAEKRFWVIEPDAVLVILLIVASLVLVYFTS